MPPLSTLTAVFPMPNASNSYHHKQWQATLGCLSAVVLGICLWGASVGQARAASLRVEVLDSQGQALPDAVVFLESPEAKLASKPLPQVDIAQQNKEFVPEVSVVTVGTAVNFPNRDRVRHHVYSFSPIKSFEIKLYAGLPAAPVVFDKPGIAVLGCNIHDNMMAWTVVLETPWFGKSNATGQVQLKNVPAGNYRLRTWHNSLPMGDPALDQAITVTSKESASLTVRLPSSTSSTAMQKAP